MNIPNPLLSRLFEQIAGSNPVKTGHTDLNTFGFQIDESDWSCLVADPERDPRETWLIRPFAEQSLDSGSLSSIFAYGSVPWTQDDEKTRVLRESLQSLIRKQGIEDPSNRFSIFRCESQFSLLVVKCNDLQLVADLLQTWGTPPKAVALDWQYQLKSLQNELNSLRDRLSTADTLITKNGQLLPLSIVLRHFNGASQSQGRLLEPAQSTSPKSLFPTAPEWPNAATGLTHPLESPWHLALGSAKSLNIKRNRKPVAKWLPVGFASGMVLAIGTATYLLMPDNQSNQEISPRPLTVQDETAPILAGANAESIALKSNEPREPTGATESVYDLAHSLELHNATESGEQTIELLLTQLRNKNVGLSNLGDFSATSIIDEAMESANSELPITPMDPTVGAIGESLQPAKEVEEIELKTVLSEKGIVSLERPMQIRAAKSKEFVSIGKPIIVKSCNCEIELKLPDKLIVEPSTLVTIEGVGKQVWRVAIEDEEPELLVEIESKPGSRWQIITSVGVRETTGAPPVLVGPRDAQVVGNRLILYRQWLSNAIESLRVARTNRQGKTNIDFTAEIKKREGQERELGKAIERWKLISRLTHLFFNAIEVRIQFSAKEKT